MISILTPTRKRPKQLARMVRSAWETALNPPEIVVYIDDNDNSYDLSHPVNDGIGALDVKIVDGPRILLTDTWNKCYEVSTGDILLQGNDDIIFRTPRWDVMVEEEFEKCCDKILMVHGDDLGCQHESFGAHCFVHRKWVEAVGFFIAPWFSSDFGDTVLNFAANQLDRRRYLPMAIEHQHFIFGKAVVDETTKDRLTNHVRDNPEQIYEQKLPERMQMVEKLGAVIRNAK